MLMSAELKGCVTWFIHFLDLPYVRYNCAKFHRYRICVVDFREGGPKSPPPIHKQPKKSPSWIGLNFFLIKMVTILMMSAKMATPGLFITKIFWKKHYDVIIFVHDAISPILSRDLNYNVNLVMGSKFGHSSISVREVTITSIF